MNPNYNIDLTEDEYIHFSGNTIDELKDFIYPNNFKDCCGYINGDGKGIALASVKEAYFCAITPTEKICHFITEKLLIKSLTYGAIDCDNESGWHNIVLGIRNNIST